MDLYFQLGQVYFHQKEILKKKSKHKEQVLEYFQKAFDLCCILKVPLLGSEICKALASLTYLKDKNAAAFYLSNQ